jgi:PncC family amidohydrolase
MEEPVEDLVRAVAAELDGRGYRLAVAESCTGGGLAAAITDLPGVSSFFEGGIVSYSNAVKEVLLGVPAEVLARHGAVSEPTARAMAEGVRQRIRADVGVGITGVAGPDGGTPSKPVGLVHLAVATPHGTRSRHDVWPGDRRKVRASSVQAALFLILEALKDCPAEPQP